VAGDAAGGGGLDDLIGRLEELRETDAPPGIEDAEEAARRLRAVVASPPQLATPERLDEIGAAARRLEQELDPTASSPFAAAMRSAEPAVAELQREIEGGYRVPLD
jgi:broad specificity phosphatase PhoE